MNLQHALPIFIFASIVLAGILFPDKHSKAQERSSTCLAIAQSLPHATYASFDPATRSIANPIANPAALANYDVQITYQGHSTYLIEAASGVTIATDFTGSYSSSPPKIVTMNHAHETHYTDYPDPKIEHVLRGWDPQGGVARHNLTVGDVLVRNVTTDTVIGNMRIADDNSIFIFEVAGLCIGHLGHLHHELSDQHYAKIGRLDVVMAPIDGAMTLSLGGMAKIVKRLRSSIILPMHARGWATPADFIALLGEDFDHEYLKSRQFVVSLNTLPSRPRVLVPMGL